MIKKIKTTSKIKPGRLVYITKDGKVKAKRTKGNNFVFGIAYNNSYMKNGEMFVDVVIA